jgi:hypothetical protein
MVNTLKPPKKKLKTPKQLKTILWELCKQIVRKRYMTKNGNWNCYTCGRLIDEPAKAHTAHFIPSGACGALLRYNLDNLRVCCYHCNINLGGNGSEYYRRLVEEKGQDFVDGLFRLKNQSVKADVIFYMKLISDYEKLK